jgi:hypothetical protein
MKFVSIFLKILLGIIALLVIQFTTFHTIAHGKLEDELLGSWYQRLVHDADSAFVQDYFVMDCPVGVTSVYKSHNLDKNPGKLCELLKVKHVKFQDRETFRWNVDEDRGYKLTYSTWTSYWGLPFYSDWENRIAGGFFATQYEFIQMEYVSHCRRTNYLWVLFGWIEISDVVYSTGPEDRKAMLVRLGRFEDIRH